MAFEPEIIEVDDAELVDKLNTNFDAIATEFDEPIDHADLVNKGSNTHSTIDTFIGSKAGANGLASLNSSYLVVQNPANATDTPTPLKIPIADEDGLLDDWVSDADSSTEGKVALTNHLGGTSDHPTVVNVTDNAITLAHMEHAVRGDIIYYGASGVPSRLTAGATGRVLTTKGAGADPSWDINDHVNLANRGTNTHAQIDTFVASKASASGLASLDENLLVVQNPANATATPTANAIPIADEDGMLDNWVTPGAAVTIEDDTIGLAKMSHGVRGDILYYTVDGAPARLASGTSGYILKSGGALDPSWQPLDHADLANKGTNTHPQIDNFINSKNQASGLATLTSNLKVVQNPDAATVTPTANAIPIADEYGKLDSWITPGGVTVEDDSITLAKMEHGSQGDVLYYGASGAPSRLPSGTVGQVLKSGGAAANPSWYTLNHTDLSNKGTTTHTQLDTFVASKGSIWGLASLNADLLVVQNPANATVTATANKIPIADENGKLDNWVTPGAVGDDAIQLTNMAHGNRGDILYYGIVGTPSLLSAGTAGQVLKTNGADANPSWYTLDHVDLANKGTNTHAQIDTFVGSKAAASGLASLNASSKVVEDPANSTSTPTASKIPIADAGGKLDDWITYGTTSGTSCEGNDARLSDARTPASHTIEGHTATVTVGKVLSGTGVNTFAWADPAPTWAQVSGKPSTFAPIVGTGATDACAGNDARLTNSRTPSNHNLVDTTGHPVSGLTSGHVLRATGATTYGFGAPTWADIDKTTSSLADITTKSHTALSDIGSNTHANIDTFITSKAAASGLASLNVSSKVVQDPANATSTSTASKIPIADAGGKLDTWITYGTTSGTSCQGNDVRLSDTRAPSAHVLNSASHTVSGLTTGHVLQATATNTFGFGALTWANVDKTTSSLADITTRSHTALSDKGTNTHAQIDTFVGSKAAASGLASLDVDSLVVQNPANAVVTPAASKIPIADASGKLAAGWGGSASGLATLNSSSNVVENPANATATATANKIPIADGAGKLDTWLTYGTTSGTSCQGNDARLSDSRTPTTHSHNASDVSAGTFAAGTYTFETVVLTKSSSCAISTLTDASTVTPSFATANNFTLTLGGNRTLANPTNLTPGQSGLIFLIQDGTGNRIISYGTYYDFPDGTPPALSVAASSVDVLSYFVRTSTSICCQLVKAFS